MFDFMDSGQPPEHQITHAGTNPGLTARRRGFKVPARQSTVLAEPPEGAFHDPASGQDDRAFWVGWLDRDFHPTVGGRRIACHQGSAVATTGPHQPESGFLLTGRGEDLRDSQTFLELPGLNMNH